MNQVPTTLTDTAPICVIKIASLTVCSKIGLSAASINYYFDP